MASRGCSRPLGTWLVSGKRWGVYFLTLVCGFASAPRRWHGRGGSSLSRRWSTLTNDAIAPHLESACRDRSRRPGRSPAGHPLSHRALQDVLEGPRAALPRVSVSNEGPPAAGQPTSLARILDQLHDFGSELLPLIGNQQVVSLSQVETVQAPPGSDHRLLHGQRGQELVLDAGAIAEGTDEDAGLLQVRAHVGHAAGHMHAVLFAEPPHSLGGVLADHPKLRFRLALLNQGKDVLGKVDRGVLVRAVVHDSREDQLAWVPLGVGRTEESGVDPVANGECLG